MTKQEMRKEFLARRAKLTAEERVAASREIAKRVLSLSAVIRAKTVMCYVSFREEVETKELIEALLSLGKTVCVPLCNAKTLKMTAHRIEDFSELCAGAYGILEPKGCPEVAKDSIDCILVPGAAFGRNFHRIGYGKGYYDRFLSSAKTAVTVGLCYEETLAEVVPYEATDVPLSFIVTEREVLSK
ncbi:MAG: 5-formyltetrahydrofolate cyclo-ligase [Clostridia bacterium]|nr:5-formyltetrahydrofolate cyclo-ligase [Clostridia bacterium]MBQ3553387.1 5-formyltetrahydrofolate cyclo-ligase [Clostridia bacterium]